MSLRLCAPTEKACKQVGAWRQLEEIRPGLRTGRMLTNRDQEEFYREVVSSHRHRYWAVADGGNRLVALTGLTGIDWEAGHAEVSLIVRPEESGVGGDVVALVLKEAFERMRLLHVFGECYAHNPALGFWEKMIERHGGEAVAIPGRKWWDGRLHGALVFWFTPKPD